MDKKTPSKPNNPTKDAISPELDLTIPLQQLPWTHYHDPREIQETPERSKAGGSSTTGAVQHKIQEGDPPLHRSLGKKMKGSSQDKRAEAARKTERKREILDHVMGEEADGIDVKDGADQKEVSTNAMLKEERVKKGREKTPEDKELPDEVPETPQPERKKQKIDSQ